MKKELIMAAAITLSMSSLAPLGNAKAAENTYTAAEEQVYTFTDQELIDAAKEAGYDVDAILNDTANTSTLSDINQGGFTTYAVAPPPGGGSYNDGTGVNKMKLVGDRTYIYLTATAQKVIVSLAGGAVGVLIGIIPGIGAALAGMAVGTITSVLAGDYIKRGKVFIFEMYRSSYIYVGSMYQ
ncbi:MAG: hypothetical protein ACQEWF_07530 [Bacillota bacterium]